MPDIVDGYTHVLTEHFFEELTDTFEFQGLSGRPEFLWDIEGRKGDMADYGVDKQIITLALPTMYQGMDTTSPWRSRGSPTTRFDGWPTNIPTRSSRSGRSRR